MHEREESVSTYMGNFLAIPHGTNEAKDAHHEVRGLGRPLPERRSTGTARRCKFVVGIAGINNEHLDILSKIAKVFTEQGEVAQLERGHDRSTKCCDLFGKVNA